MEPSNGGHWIWGIVVLVSFVAVAVFAGADAAFHSSPAFLVAYLATRILYARRGGAVLLKLGRGDLKGSREGLFLGVGACLLGLLGLSEAFVFQSPRGPTLPHKLVAPTGYLVVGLWSVLRWLRGVSIREHGLTTSFSLILWDSVAWYSLASDGGTLLMRIKGVGLLRSLIGPGPRSDCLLTWPIPAEHRDTIGTILSTRGLPPLE
jgi:hypothetical protein